MDDISQGDISRLVYNDIIYSKTKQKKLNIIALQRQLMHFKVLYIAKSMKAEFSTPWDEKSSAQCLLAVGIQTISK